MNKLQETARGVAVLHLLRIERDNGYSALVAKRNASNTTTATDPITTSETSSENALNLSNLGPEGQGKNTVEVEETRTKIRQHSTRETTRLVAGVTRWRRQLDCAISNVCERSADSLDASVRQVPPSPPPHQNSLHICAGECTSRQTLCIPSCEYNFHSCTMI
jgi:hypothetical protein